MKDTARLYYCTGCHCQAIICSQCDHGNIYCSLDCAQQSRKASLRAANQRYQDSHQGRLHHAARQSRYRKRQQQKVTYQGSLTEKSDLLSQALKQQVTLGVPVTSNAPSYCHFCGKEVTEFLRRGFLSHLSALLRSKRSASAQGP